VNLVGRERGRERDSSLDREFLNLHLTQEFFFSIYEADEEAQSDSVGARF
jgi:hypothetical protein